MSKYEIFMKTTILNKIKKCKKMYKNLQQDHGTIIEINEILTKLETLHNSCDSIQNKIYLLNELRININPKKIFANKYILPNNLKFCDEVNYAVAWAQDYYKGLLNENKLNENK